MTFLTPFGEIMRRAVEATPGAVGGAFADSEGEMVDCFSSSYDPHDWAVLTAHYGVVLRQLRSVFGIWHYGAPEYFIAEHSVLGVVVYTIQSGYYALLAVTDPGELAPGALSTLRDVASALQKEMQ